MRRLTGSFRTWLAACRKKKSVFLRRSVDVESDQTELWPRVAELEETLDMRYLRR